MHASWDKIGNGVFSAAAGLAAFALTLLGFLLLGSLDQQIVASLFIGLFALMVVHLAAERPKSGHARAVAALIDRLLAVRRGDLSSPAPPAVRTEMPALAAAVDGLFEQVRSSLDNFRTMAMYDPVTALPNRIHFRREAERILKERQEGERSALLFIDLDGFKEVNDRLGHAQGDQVLTMVANRLRVVVKAEADLGASPPLLARLAGDEFTLLLPDVSGSEEAERIACRALAAVAEPFSIVGQPCNMGASIGVAMTPDHAADLAGLMKAADTAMYHAKASGRSRVCLYDAALAEATEQRAALEKSLRGAIDKDSLDLVYRPRLCLRSGAIVAGEAVVRWEGAAGGPILVEDLGSLAYAAGLTHRLSEWTLERALAAAARWHAGGVGQRLSFRLAAGEIELDLAGRLRAAAAAASVPWSVLELEIDGEAAAMCKNHVRAEIAQLRKEGLKILVAGFGGGRSGLSATLDFPVDRVKLDPALIAEVDSSERARTALTALVHLIHGLGCEAVAPPVQRQEQLEVLRAVGCDAVEGMFRADPLAEDAFAAWVASQDCARSLARAG